MLVAFSVGNFRSFQDTQTLNLLGANIISKDKKLDDNNLITIDKKTALVTSAVVYGANASGKSNLVAAVRFMRGFVLNSSRDTQVEDKIPVEPFKLSSETEDKPSFFQVVFILNGIRYRYGFEVSEASVVSEWLYYIPKTREARLFERDYQEFHIAENYKEGRGVEVRTRENALFLSVVAQFNGDLSRRILSWFRDLTVNLGVSDTMEQANAIHRFSQLRDKGGVLAFIKALDLGISDILAIEETISLPSDSNMPEALVKLFQSMEDTEVTRIKTLHDKYDSKGKKIGNVVFDMQTDESQGTQRLFNLAVPILESISHGRILFVDELDARMHPLLTCALIALFNSKETNKKNAQLVFTTHDTNLLSNKIFRRDQIWFTEKNRRGSTRLYSLVEFKARNDASFDKDYIKGRYGAVPFINNVEALFEVGDE